MQIQSEYNIKVLRLFLQCVEICNNISKSFILFNITEKFFGYFSFRVVENGKETVTVTEDGKVVKHLVNGEEKQAIKG